MKKKQKKMSASAMIWLVFFALLAILVAAGVFYVVFGGRNPSGEVNSPTEIAGIDVHTDYISSNSIARPGRTRQIHYIVIHETDNTGAQANAEAHNQYIHDNSWTEQKSWHYTVDDTEIWHHLPDQEVGYHAGDNSHREGGNRNGIGIELCVNRGGDFDQTMQNAAQLTAYLLIAYDLDMDAVQQHRDFSGKICPSTIIAQGRWDEFLGMVQDAYDVQSRQIALGSE